MRALSQDNYGIPRERVIRSSTFAYASDDQSGTITNKPEADHLDPGEVSADLKPGRTPLLAAGNSNKDSAMRESAQSRECRRRDCDMSLLMRSGLSPLCARPTATCWRRHIGPPVGGRTRCTDAPRVLLYRRLNAGPPVGEHGSLLAV